MPSWAFCTSAGLSVTVGISEKRQRPPSSARYRTRRPLSDPTQWRHIHGVRHGSKNAGISFLRQARGVLAIHQALRTRDGRSRRSTLRRLKTEGAGFRLHVAGKNVLSGIEQLKLATTGFIFLRILLGKR